MKYLATILLSLILIQGYSQERKKITDKDQQEVLDQFNPCFIPEDAIWMGADHPEAYRYITDRVLIYHFWSPLNPNYTKVMSELKSIKEVYPNAEIIDFLHPDDISLFTPKEAYTLWSDIELYRPLIIGVNTTIENTLTSREDLRLMLSVNRGGATFIEAGDLARTMDQVLEAMEVQNQEELESLPTHQMNEIASTAMLAYPKGIASFAEEDMLFISDTGNNRILGIDNDGTLAFVIGSGVAGFSDGAFGACSFNHPTDIVMDQSSRKLYVADMYNHAIREIDLSNYTVNTVLGTGSEAAILEKTLIKGQQAISYPSGLLLNGSELFITMKERNMIYSLDLSTGQAVKVTGSGLRKSKDEKLEKASFNYPGAMAFLDDDLCVLEETLGNIRRIRKNKVETIYDNAVSDSLQLFLPGSLHTLGGTLYVLDTYNHAVRSIDSDGKLSHVTGGGKGFKNGTLETALFNAPTDMCVLGKKIYLVDALNNAVRVVIPEKQEVRTLEIKGDANLYPGLRAVQQPKYTTNAAVRSGENMVVIELNLPEELQISSEGIEAVVRSGSHGKVISTDGESGLILVGVGILDHTETSYIDVNFIAENIDIPSHKLKYSSRILLKYIPSDGEGPQPVKINF